MRAQRLRLRRRKTNRAPNPKPNVLIVLADQWRAQAFGFAGDPNVRTPNFDHLAGESTRFVNAISGLPVCSPTRASLMTGQRPLTHGVFLNDVQLNTNAVTLAKTLKAAGYQTGIIGKWHIDGRGRSNFIPRERRQGFDYWKVLECTHNYTHSFYYANDPTKRTWTGYDAVAQTRDARDYIRAQSHSNQPFALVLAWGPPHDPYFTAPAKYRALYDVAKLQLRPNIPAGLEPEVRKFLAGYYAHCTALDDCMGEILNTLRATSAATNTILLFSADHGDMLGSQGQFKKQRPFDESIRVPMLIRWPAGLGTKASSLAAPINSEDIMPTVLGLCGVGIPRSVEGLDYSAYLRGGTNPGDDATLFRCVAPFGEWERRIGGREYRAVRSCRHSHETATHGVDMLGHRGAARNRMGGRSQIHGRLLQALAECGDGHRDDRQLCPAVVRAQDHPHRHGLCRVDRHRSRGHGDHRDDVSRRTPRDPPRAVHRAHHRRSRRPQVRLATGVLTSIDVEPRDTQFA